jgi:hypothetical protein
MEEFHMTLDTFLGKAFNTEDFILPMRYIGKVFILLTIALKDLHSIQVAHGSFSAKNIMLTTALFPVVIGFSKSTRWSPFDMANADAALQRKQQKEAEAADMIALGKLLFFMLTGGIEFVDRSSFTNNEHLFTYENKGFFEIVASLLLVRNPVNRPSAEEVLNMAPLVLENLVIGANNLLYSWRLDLTYTFTGYDDSYELMVDFAGRSVTVRRVSVAPEKKF